jgi:Secretory lipase
MNLSRFAATGAFVVFLSLGGDPAEALYDVELGEVPGKPGTIIRVWPLLGGGPGDSDAFRFLYRSTGPKGETIPVSGAIFIPSGPAPAGGRNVIAWAHPTSGVAPACAPSLYPHGAGLIWNLSDMLGHGYVIVATDYPGLGTDGIHPYLIGESAGRAVLDSVRAARHSPRAALPTVLPYGGTAKVVTPLYLRASLPPAMRRNSSLSESPRRRLRPTSSNC